MPATKMKKQGQGQGQGGQGQGQRMPAIGVNMRVTAHYTQGQRRHMEDKMSVAYQQTEDDMDFDFVYVGIFDGHGGAEAALFAKEHLLEAIVRQKGFWSTRDQDVLRAIRQGYIITHLNIWRALEKWPLHVNGLPSTAGTTASVAFVRRGKIYIGHVGDSAIVLGYQEEGREKWSAKALTLDHKPGIEPEISRIHSSGGKVIPKLGIPRVVWKRPILGSEENGWDEVPFLAIARSLGDIWSYNPESDDFIVSPEPDVGVIEIDPAKFRCLIFGTDGLWNMINPSDAVDIVYEAEKHNEKELNSTDAGRQPVWLNPSQKLVDNALDRWSDSHMRADNISVVTLMLDPPGPPRKSSMIKFPSASSKHHISCPSEGACKASDSKAEAKTSNSSSNNEASDSGDASTSAAPQDISFIQPTSPVSNMTSKYGMVNYGNPTESYFVARLLNKTNISNTLERVHEEINRVNILTDSQEETIINNSISNETTITKKTILQRCSVTANRSSESDSETSSSSSESVEISVKEESIQINEVSSSSLDLKVKNKTKTTIVKAENANTRSLRSRETVTLSARPPLRHSRKAKVEEPQIKSESKLPIPVQSKNNEQREKVVVMTRPKTLQSPEEQSPKVNVKLQKRVPVEVKSKTNADIKHKVTSGKETRMTRSKDVQSPSIDSKNNQSQDVISKENDKDSPDQPKDFCSANFSPPKRTFLRNRQQNVTLENSEESLKENIILPNQKQAPLKSVKRRNNASGAVESEPKEKRRTRLDDKKEPRTDQQSPVTSTEDSTYLLDLRFEDEKKSASQDTSSIDSTSSVENAKLPKSKQTNSSGNEKRALRSSNCIQPESVPSDQCRPILRSKNTVNSVVSPKPNPRRKGQWPHAFRHNLRKRQTSK